MEALNHTAELPLQLALLQSRISRRMESSLTPHGLSFSEFTVLHRLSEAPGGCLRRVELADSVGLTASGVTRMLLPMEKTGLVERETDPRDARVSQVRLSRAGKRVYRESRASFVRSADLQCQRLNKEQIAQLRSLIGLLL